VEWKTLANHKANAKRALHWYRQDNALPLRGAELPQEWRQLRKCIAGPSHPAKLTGLIRYCGMNAIAPAEVTEAVLDDYMRYRAETTALAVNTKARRAIARAWNACLPVDRGLAAASSDGAGVTTQDMAAVAGLSGAIAGGPR
jgi:hypothetical protein